MLSTLMSYHPRALVLSEFFGGLDVVNAFRTHQVSGEELAAILLQDHEISNLNRMRQRVDHEILVDLKRYDSVRLPAIMLVCLPALTSDPDGLLREIVGWARARKPALVGEHYSELFGWLTRLFHKEFWIERSGGSGEFFQQLRRSFPQARYLHLHREGTEAALSMANQHHFQTHVSFFFDPPLDDEIAQAIRRQEPAGEELVVRRARAARPAADFGRFWTLSICLILSEVQHLQPSQYREFRYEALRQDPGQFLREVCDYFECSAEGDWIEKALGIIRPERNQRSSALDPDSLAALEAAVFPGEVLLKRAMTDRPNRPLFKRIRAIWDSIDTHKPFPAFDPASRGGR
jgi:hypothetical protein